MKVFADANILFSASKRDSLIQRLLAAVRLKGEMVTSEYVLEEARRNLEQKYPERMEEFERLCNFFQVVEGTAESGEVSLTEKDRPVLDGAIAAGCSHLLTGDRTHFGHLFCQTVQGVHIVSPQMLTEELARL